MAGQQQQSQGGDNSLAPLWITALIFLTAAIIWYFAQEYIVAFVLNLRLYEAKSMSLFTSSVTPVVNAIQSIPRASYATVPFEQLMDISDTVGGFLRYPVVLILAVLAVVIYVGSATNRYKKSYTMQRLLDDEKIDW